MENGDKLLWINNDDDDDDNGDYEQDKIPTHHLGFCPLGFILHTIIMIFMMIMMMIPPPLLQHDQYNSEQLRQQTNKQTQQSIQHS